MHISDMKPLDYLRSNTSIIGSCLVIYSRVFEKYNTNSETRTIHENVNDNLIMANVTYYFCFLLIILTNVTLL